MKEKRLSGFRKVLMIVSEFPPGPGGIGNHAHNLAKYLNKNDFEVKVLAVSDFVEQRDEEEFDRKQDFGVVRFKRYDNRLKTYKKRLEEIQKVLKEESFSHVIFSGRFSLLSSNLLKRFHKNTKFISIVHGGDVNAENAAEKYFISTALKNSDLIVAVSNYSKSFIKKSLHTDKVIVIPNGFDFDNMEELVIKEKYLLNGTLNLVTVGTVWPRKGHHNVMKALPEVISDYPNLKYNIIGRLADLSMVKEYFDDDKFKNFLKVHGPISNSDMQTVLSQSQIFIMLSESQSSGDFEGFGIAVLEANFFGLPAIGSKNSGLEDSIKDGVSGILVDPKNTKETSEAVKTISENYTRFSEGAKQWAMKHHWSEIIKRYIKAIDNIQ